MHRLSNIPQASSPTEPYYPNSVFNHTMTCAPATRPTDFLAARMAAAELPILYFQQSLLALDTHLELTAQLPRVLQCRGIQR